MLCSGFFLPPGAAVNLAVTCPNPDAWDPREQSQLRTAKESQSFQLSREVEEGLGECRTVRPKFPCSNAFKGLTRETELLNMANKALPGLDPNLLQPYLPTFPSLYLLQSHWPPGPPDLLTPGPLHMLLFLTRMLFSPLLLDKLPFITSSRKSSLTTH